MVVNSLFRFIVFAWVPWAPKTDTLYKKLRFAHGVVYGPTDRRFICFFSVQFGLGVRLDQQHTFSSVCANNCKFLYRKGRSQHTNFAGEPL